MDRPRNPTRTLRMLAGLVLLFSVTAQAGAALPHPFRANYALEIYSTVVARATYTLEHTGDGIVMTQQTRPAGLVSLLRDDRIDVYSRMHVHDGVIYLDEYRYTHSGSEDDNNVHIGIDWSHSGEASTGRLAGVYEGKDFEQTSTKPVWDPLSVQIPMMLHAEQDLPPHDHQMVMKNEIRTYEVINAGRESLEIEENRYDTIKLIGREKTRDRAMHIWVAPELHFIPVKIDQWRDGKLKSTVYLTGASFPAEDEENEDFE